MLIRPSKSAHICAQSISVCGAWQYIWRLNRGGIVYSLLYQRIHTLAHTTKQNTHTHTSCINKFEIDNIWWVWPPEPPERIFIVSSFPIGLKMRTKKTEKDSMNFVVWVIYLRVFNKHFPFKLSVHWKC